jgi:hypothetical protein
VPQATPDQPRQDGAVPAQDELLNDTIQLVDQPLNAAIR